MDLKMIVGDVCDTESNPVCFSQDWLMVYKWQGDSILHKRLSPFLHALGQMPRCMLRNLKQVVFLKVSVTWFVMMSL